MILVQVTGVDRIPNPLLNVPLNTKKVYVGVIAPGGCEVYMPVDSHNDNVINVLKQELQNYLNSIPITSSRSPILA